MRGPEPEGEQVGTRHVAQRHARPGQREVAGAVGQILQRERRGHRNERGREQHRREEDADEGGEGDDRTGDEHQDPAEEAQDGDEALGRDPAVGRLTRQQRREDRRHRDRRQTDGDLEFAESQLLEVGREDGLPGAVDGAAEEHLDAEPRAEVGLHRRRNYRPSGPMEHGESGSPAPEARPLAVA